MTPERIAKIRGLAKHDMPGIYTELLDDRDRLLAELEDLRKPRMFPVQKSSPIPWEVAEQAYKVYAFRYGATQSLERMSERGGFSVEEMDMFHPSWRETTSCISQLRDDLADSRHETQCKEDSKDALRELMHGTQQERQDLKDERDQLRTENDLMAFGIGQIVRNGSDTEQGRLASHVLAECRADDSRPALADPEDSKYRFWCSLLACVSEDHDKRAEAYRAAAEAYGSFFKGPGAAFELLRKARALDPESEKETE